MQFAMRKLSVMERKILSIAACGSTDHIFPCGWELKSFDALVEAGFLRRGEFDQSRNEHIYHITQLGREAEVRQG